MHNSLVGDIIKAKNGVCLLSKSCRIGKQKAAVFPLPVSANPMMSLPFNA
jgi:hypothetical protein